MQVRHLAYSFIQSIQERFKFHQDVEKAINGGISFGVPDTILIAGGFQTRPKHCDNIDGVLVMIPNSGSANTQFIVIHNLGRVPMGIDLKYSNVSGVWYDSGTTWTKTQIFIKFSGNNAKLILHIH